MSGICGWVGESDPEFLDLMLGAIDYRGDTSAKNLLADAALGYRWWKDRPGKSNGILHDEHNYLACAGTLAPPHANPARRLLEILKHDIAGLETLDGAFAGAWWNSDTKSLTLIRDPFGVRSLYYVEHDRVVYFATELKQLLAIPILPVKVDAAAIHKYLTFSFVPGVDVPIEGVRRILPGHTATWNSGVWKSRPYFTLKEEIDPKFDDQSASVKAIRRRCKEAVANRLNGESSVGVYLSGGLDSSGIAHWLKEADSKLDLKLLSLDFGDKAVEKEEAAMVAKHLGLPLEFIPARGEDVASNLMDVVWKLDLPFGDPVTGPHYLLGKAARAAGLTAVFNGEGGDQLFGGWTSKPMISAELYGDLFGLDSREEMYLQSYHRFYGLEDDLYTPELQKLVGGPGQRRAHLHPFVHSENASTFLNRIRLADIALKGSQNILPRAERIGNAWGLDIRVPLFDRALAATSFRLPPKMKLSGACEKFVLKLVLNKHLPKEIVWKKKYGMSVPITEWVLGPLSGVIDELLGAASLRNRGYFRSEYVGKLIAGENDPHETRKRRLGEKIWCLAMLEAWMRVFIDGRGRKPAGNAP